MHETEFITYPTWKKYIVIANYVQSFRIKDKRMLFNHMRQYPNLSSDTFLPTYGITAGDFAIWQILCNSRNFRRSKKTPKLVKKS